MDISGLSTSDRANEGEWFEVELYGSRQGFELKILGDDSDAVRRHSEKALRNVKVGKGVSFEAAMMSEMIDASEENVIVRIAGIRAKGGGAVTMCGHTLDDGKESCRLLVSKIPAIKDFVLEKSRDRNNFLAGASESLKKL